MRCARAALHRPDCRASRLHGVLAPRIWHGFRARGRVSDDEAVRHCGEYCYLLPDLLAVAQWQGSGARRIACGHHYGAAIGSSEIRVYPRASLAQLSGGLRTVLTLGEHDVLGVPVRAVAVGGRQPFGRRLSATQSLESLAWNGNAGEVDAALAVDAADHILQRLR